MSAGDQGLVQELFTKGIGHTKFKETPIGRIPMEWRVVKLKDCLEERKEHSRPPHREEKYIGLEHFHSGALSINGYDNSRHVTSNCLVFNKGDLLYGKLRPYLDKAVLSKFDGVCSTEVLVFKEKGPMIKELLIHYFHFNKFIRYAAQNSCGTKMPRTSTKVVFEFKVPLPPLPEQRKIAAILSSVDAAIEKTEEIIAQTEQVKKGLIQELLTRGIGNTVFKETPIGTLPEEWRVVRLGEVVEKSKQIDPRKTPEWCFKYIDVSSIDNQRLRVVGYQKYSGRNAPSRARKPVKAGDVIFATVRFYLKRMALIPPEFDGHICSTAFCVLRADGHLAISEYLFSVVSHDRFVASVSKHQHGSSYPAVTDGDVLREFIPLPPLPEQRKIAAILSTLGEMIEAERKYRNDLVKLKRGLMQDLLTGKVRVKVDAHA